VCGANATDTQVLRVWLPALWKPQFGPHPASQIRIVAFGGTSRREVERLPELGVGSRWQAWRALRSTAIQLRVLALQRSALVPFALAQLPRLSPCHATRWRQ
jgi:hypothetical protein